MIEHTRREIVGVVVESGTREFLLKVPGSGRGNLGRCSYITVGYIANRSLHLAPCLGEPETQLVRLAPNSIVKVAPADS